MILKFCFCVDFNLLRLVFNKIDCIRSNLKFLVGVNLIFFGHRCFCKTIGVKKGMGNHAGIFSPRLYLIDGVFCLMLVHSLGGSKC